MCDFVPWMGWGPGCSEGSYGKGHPSDCSAIVRPAPCGFAHHAWGPHSSHTDAFLVVLEHQRGSQLYSHVHLSTGIGLGVGMGEGSFFQTRAKLWNPHSRLCELFSPQ